MTSLYAEKSAVYSIPLVFEALLFQKCMQSISFENALGIEIDIVEAKNEEASKSTNIPNQLNKSNQFDFNSI